MPLAARARRLNVPQGDYEPLRPIKGRPVDRHPARRFIARLTNESDTSGQAVESRDFLQAALTFAETCAASDVPALQIAVTDADTGETHCFTVGLD